jgi:UDP-N-acetyl-2-amino-2-deoxyglucuronate dehydrogenase
VATNIGIHFFDMLIWLFGPVVHNEVHLSDSRRTSGTLELQRARVKWFLSIERDDLPPEVRSAGRPTFRSITVDGQEIDFTSGFSELHTRVYEEALAGRGFRIDTVRPSVQLAHDIRHAELLGPRPDSHPFLRQ